MASHLRPDVQAEVQDWLRQHNVVVEDLALDDSSSWPLLIAPFAQLLPENQSSAPNVKLEHGPWDPEGTLDSLTDRLDLFIPSACASFLLYGKSHGPLLRTVVIRHIAKLLHPSLTVYDRVEFAMPRSDTGSASLDSAFHPTKGRAEILILLERATTACESPTSAYYRDPSEVPFAHRKATTSNYTSSTAPAYLEEVLDRTSDWRSVERRMWDEPFDRDIEEEEYSDEIEHNYYDDDTSEGKGQGGDEDGRDDVGEDDTGEDDSGSAYSDGDTPFLSGELNPHRHVLSTCHPHPLIPVLCVADELNLLPLMTSTLYQRRAWNLEVPVVGILLPRSSTTCKVLFGWVEESPGSTHALPLVHILAPVLGRADAGLFDLCVPEHLMRMTQFLAALGPHIAGLIQDSGDPVSDASLPWRADEHMREIAEDRGLDGRIWNWLCDVSSTDLHAQEIPTNHGEGSKRTDINRSPVPERSSAKQSVASYSGSAFAQRKPRNDNKPVFKGVEAITKPDATQPSAHVDVTITEWVTDQWNLSYPYTTAMNCQLRQQAIDLRTMCGGAKNVLTKAFIQFVRGEAHTLCLAIDEVLPHEKKPETTKRGGCLSPQTHDPNTSPVDHKSVPETHALLAKLTALVPLRCVHAFVEWSYRREVSNEAEWRHAWDLLFHVCQDILLQGYDPETYNDAQFLHINYCAEATIKYLRCEAYDQFRHPNNLTGLEGSDLPSGRFLHDQIATVFNKHEEFCREGEAKLLLAPLSSLQKRLDGVGYVEELDAWKSVCAQSSAAATAIREQQSPFLRAALGGDLKSQLENLKFRLAGYPKTGRCDAAFTVVIPQHDFYKRIREITGLDTPTDDFMKYFPGITSSRKLPTPHKGLGNGAAPDSVFAATLCSSLSVAKHGSPSLEHALQLPYLVIDYKLDDQELMGEAERQRRMNSVSAAAFLRALGITDFNVYGIAQSGPYHTVSATWYSSEDKVYYTCDQGVPRFDFHKFEDVMRFAAFTLELKEHARTLKERYDAVKDAFFTRVEEEFKRCGGELPDLDSDLWWTATLQADLYGIHPH